MLYLLLLEYLILLISINVQEFNIFETFQMSRHVKVRNF